MKVSEHYRDATSQIVCKIQVSTVGLNGLIVDDTIIKAFGDIDTKQEFDSECLKQVQKTERHLRSEKS